MPRPENAELYKKYKALADATPGVHFVGRLATYKYYNMDQVVGAGAGDVPAHHRGFIIAFRSDAVGWRGEPSGVNNDRCVPRVVGRV